MCQCYPLCRLRFIGNKLPMSLSYDILATASKSSLPLPLLATTNCCCPRFLSGISSCRHLCGHFASIFFPSHCYSSIWDNEPNVLPLGASTIVYFHPPAVVCPAPILAMVTLTHTPMLPKVFPTYQFPNLYMPVSPAFVQPGSQVPQPPFPPQRFHPGHLLEVSASLLVVSLPHAIPSTPLSDAPPGFLGFLSMLEAPISSP